MTVFLRTALVAAIALAPAAALAQAVIVEAPPMMEMEQPVVMLDGPLTEGDASAIAMANGLVMIDEVDRKSNGDFEVEGEDASGNDMEFLIDGMTGDILDMDD